MNAQAALDPPMQRAPAIQGEIMAGTGAQQDHNFLQGTLGFSIKVQIGFADARELPAISDELIRQVLDGSHEIRQPRLYGAARHGFEFCGGRILNQHDAALLLNRPEAQRAVAAHARQKDADAALVLIFGERIKKEIDRQA